VKNIDLNIPPLTLSDGVNSVMRLDLPGKKSTLFRKKHLEGGHYIWEEAVI